MLVVPCALQGNITHALPGSHPIYYIPTSAYPHDEKFEKSSATPEAVQATLRAALAVSIVGLRVIQDDNFREECHKAWLREAAKGGPA